MRVLRWLLLSAAAYGERSIMPLSEIQLHRAYRRAWHDALPELLRTPRDVTVWEPIRADGEPPRVGT